MRKRQTRSNPGASNVCVLVVAVQWHSAWPLVVAANRDEAYRRPSSAPEVERLVEGVVLRPLDAQAGGTWEGLNSHGLLAVLTNRRDGDFDARRRSRGLLCREALEQASVAQVGAFLSQAVRAEPYNSFNLVYADPETVCLSSWNGKLETRSLPRGTHVLSNEHGLGELSLPELELPAPTRPDAARQRLLEILASHDVRDARGFRICKHGDLYGTVSSTLLFRDPSGKTWLEHAPGPPCRTAYVRHDLS